MKRGALQAGAAALGPVLAIYVYSGIVLDVSLARGVHWAPIVGGLLTGGAVLTVWTFVRSRRAAAFALAALAALVVLGTPGSDVGPLVAGDAMTWAVLLALVLRVIVTPSRHTRDARTHAVADRHTVAERGRRPRTSSPSCPATAWRGARARRPV